MKDKELEKIAKRSEKENKGEFVRRLRKPEDFLYDEVQEKYWDTTSGILLGAKSVDGAVPKHDWPTTPNAKGDEVPVKPSLAINDVMTGLTVETSTWWPGRPMILENTIVTARGDMCIKGAKTYNTYVAPKHKKLKKRAPKPNKWIAHVKKLFPDPIENEHFFNFAAHMIQRPDEKVNHGLVIAGSQGIGKDTAIHPLIDGVGEWNSVDISPDAISSDYNPYVQSVLLIINDVRPHDEDHKASNFYGQIKDLLAAPPNMLPMDMKHINTIYVRNLCHVILTANEPLKMYIPKEDRRLFVMTSPLPDPKENDVFPDLYFERLWEYLSNGGTESVIFWLLKRDLSCFNPTAPPPMTSGKSAIIESANCVRRTLVDKVFESYCEHVYRDEKPEIVFGKDLIDFVQKTHFFDDKQSALRLLGAKNFHFKMNDLGYDMIINPHSSEWKSGKYRSRAAFALKSMLKEEQIIAVQNELSKRPLEFSHDLGR